MHGKMKIKKFPKELLFKTRTETFNHEYYFIVRDGRIWFKPFEIKSKKVLINKEKELKHKADEFLSQADQYKRSGESKELSQLAEIARYRNRHFLESAKRKREAAEKFISGKKSQWELLGGSGLPGRGGGKKPFKNLNKIIEISADGDNLVALSDTRVIYYTKIFNLKWKKRFSIYPCGKLKMPENTITWSITHRGPVMKYYLDIDGNPHETGPGVTTLYKLASNSHEITFTDPWIPPDFNFYVDTPFKGSLIVENMSASGSTVFIITMYGNMYTRLFDFDTSGQNPFLQYSYQRKVRIGKQKTVRSLPPEDWYEQPRINGTITKTITIFQNGDTGNSGFDLRVEGKNKNGDTGYYCKSIYGEKWTFVKTGHTLTGEILDNNFNEFDRQSLTSPKTKFYTGQIYRKRDKAVLRCKLVDFYPYSSPAQLVIDINDQEFVCNFHMRKIKEKSGNTMKMFGTLELPDDLVKSEDKKIKKIFKELFKLEKLTDLLIKLNEDSIKVKEDLHIIGLSEIADNFIRFFNPGGEGILSAKFHKRLRISLKEIISGN